MTASNLRSLWTAVLIFYALNAFLSNRGVNPIFDVTLIDDRARVESLFALPVCALLLVVVSRIGRLYARQHTALAWHARLPVVFLKDMDTASREGRTYQLFFFVVFIVLSALAILHFFLQIMGADVSLKAGGPKLSPWDIVSLNKLGAETYIIGDTYDGERVKCGVDWFPVVEPLAFAGLALWAWIEALRLALCVFRKPE